MATHSSILAWRIPWTEEPGGLQSMGRKESDTTEQLHFHFSLSCIGEGNGNPLQCSCLENPRDGGTWWAAVYGIAQSRTRLKRLSSSSSSSSSSSQAYHLSGVLRYAFKAFSVKQSTCYRISQLIQRVATCKLSKTKWFTMLRSVRTESSKTGRIFFLT